MMARVLVVDDQKVSRLTVAGILGEAGHSVRTEACGDDGLGAAREWLPDVIVLDVHMPGMDGFRVVERLKQDPVTATIPVIFLTGDPPTDDLVVRGLQLGAYDFLSKGGSKAELLARVGVMERIKRGHDDLAAIARISDTLLQCVDPDALGQRFIAEIVDVFRASAAVLAVERHGKPRLHISAGLDMDDPTLVDLLQAVREPLMGGRSAASEILDADGIHRLIEPHLGDDFRSVGLACVPRGPSTALVMVLATEPGHFRPDIDAPLLWSLSSQASIAIEHALLNESAHIQARGLERAIDERSRFFASLSHELRTPINAVIGYNHLLREGIFGPLSDRQEEAVDKANRSAQHLLELVDDILDISKIEAGKLEIFPEEVDLAQLLGDTATSLQLQARNKEIDLTVHAAGSVRITTDPARVRQIVLNLLSNAVKFTDEGRVDLRLHEADDDRVAVLVSDTGPGIQPDDRERIFEEFEQGGTGSPGTGLGLAISRRLAELLGGDLTVDSEVGAGSTFTLSLPRNLPAPGGNTGPDDD